ncbi:MAG: hypothetical protein FE037_03900 [Thermoplasmata archaeon]|nr:MAG: hypothetical protein FE042_02880 [Thermoplasmata archaeon]KAA0011652.1 MAG: hypothetical protein FE037_03900 [Thermoplasmata archaeon]
MKREVFVAFAILIISLSALSYILISTPVYNDVKDKIVSVLCLSCIKMEPRTVLKFRFETVNGGAFPDLILENLTESVIFLHFRIDVCPACNEMDPIVRDMFGLESIDEPYIVASKNFSGVEVKLIHINLDHADSELKKLYKLFDVAGENGVPMFTVVTLGYDRGIVKPCYATGYGFLGKSSPSAAGKVIMKMINDAVELYKRNREGYGG